MKRTIIYFMILLISLTSCGCYSHFPIMEDELVECEKEVIIFTKDAFYTFPAGQYAKMDTLVYGKGWISNNENKEKRIWEGAISVNDITNIEAEKEDVFITTTLVVIAMAAIIGIVVVIISISDRIRSSIPHL
jgi:hypothetical protein